MLGIETKWRDYGTDSAVADFEMECGLPKEVSRIVLDPARPYGFFYFAPGRWRLIYRVNRGEDRRALTTEAAATELLLSKLPEARVEGFLWASAFRLGQGQSTTYRRGRWLLAGDAAHAMGPSAGAGMMVGVLGAWRLGWRLALAVEGLVDPEELLEGYEREQRAASEEIQNANALIFRNMAVANRLVGTAAGWHSAGSLVWDRSFADDGEGGVGDPRTLGAERGTIARGAEGCQMNSGHNFGRHGAE
jgi:2-polyprenyl-6-methoxyphenol hydroxylase-like FAD-dependent oxidoreductase